MDAAYLADLVHMLDATSIFSLQSNFQALFQYNDHIKLKSASQSQEVLKNLCLSMCTHMLRLWQ